MVTTQLRGRGIRDDRVLEAMGRLRREDFVPEGMRRFAYDDAALPIEAGQSISQPYMVAWMTELLDVRPGDRILEIGTGSGYQTAVLALLGASLVTYEREPVLEAEARERLASLGLADQVDFRGGDGSLGDPGGGTYRGIIVTAGAPSVPQGLLDQLDDGGRLVIPVGSRALQELVLVTREGDHWIPRDQGSCVFVPLVGAGGWHPRRVREK